MKKKLIIGLITYNEATLKYLPYFFSSLEEQEFKDFKVLVFDNSDDAYLNNREFVQNEIDKKVLEIELDFFDKNLGFARAFNKMIEKSFFYGSQYFLAINPDVVLDKKATKKMIEKIDADNNLGSVCPKIYYWDFENNQRTKIVDSLGIKEYKPLRFVDLGQGEIDDGQFDDVEIIGPSGAVAMYRMSALEKIKIDEQYFDEKMFMYKEDCDLAYRLFVSGFKSKCVKDSLAYHDRTARAEGLSLFDIIKNRKNKSKQVRIWSFCNQQIIFFKHWGKQSFSKKLSIIFYEIQVFVFIVLFERFLLKELKSVFKK